MDQLKRFKEKTKRKLRIGSKNEANTAGGESTGSALSFRSGVIAEGKVEGGDEGIPVTKVDVLATRPDDTESAPQPGAGEGGIAGGSNDTGGGAIQDNLDKAVPPDHPGIANIGPVPQDVEPKRTWPVSLHPSHLVEGRGT